MGAQERLNALKNNIRTMESAYARAEANKETATQQIRSILSELETQYNVKTVAEVKERISELQESIDRQLTEAENAVTHV